MKATKNKYWYFKYIGECPVCGKDASYKERRPMPRPDTSDIKFAHELNGITLKYLSQMETYCGCQP